MQFGFKEGVGCTEASFTILESINHMLERRSKVLGCFLDVRKALILYGLMAYISNCFQSWQQGVHVAGHKKLLHWCESSGPLLGPIVKEV